MKLRANRLAAHLSKPLAPVYFVSGDEPFQMDEACNAIRAAALQQGYSERQVMHVDKQFDWHSLAASADALSLFAEKRLIELRLPSARPGDAGAKALVAYTDNPPEDTVLLLVAGKLEAAQTRSKWFKAVEQAGVVIQIWPVEAKQLPEWIRQRMQLRGMQPTDEAVRILADRVEGNLLAADQELEKLLLLTGGGAVDAEQVAAAVSDSARYDVFSLVDTALLGESARSVHILQGLRAEGLEPPIILWALARELRTLVNMAQAVQQGSSVEQVLAQYRVWDKRKAAIRAALQRHNSRRLQGLLWQCGDIDRMIKGLAAGKPWDELIQLVLKMAGTPLFRRTG